MARASAGVLPSAMQGVAARSDAVYRPMRLSNVILAFGGAESDFFMSIS
jgi:hypothetical protein